MESVEHHQLPTQKNIEDTPFQESLTRRLFTRWTRINDSIIPQFVSRRIWEETYRGNILRVRPDGKKDLFLPKNLHIWEMIDIVAAIDRDTFVQNPERAKEKKQDLSDLANTFRNAGIYIAKRLDSIEDGRELAEHLARTFWNYGTMLALGHVSENNESLESIASNPLDASTTRLTDQWLAGDTLYASRRERALKEIRQHPTRRTSITENERRKTLKQFFRVLDHAYDLDDQDLKTSDDGRSKPWENQKSVHDSFIERIASSTNRAIDTPYRELYGAVFRRGVERLIQGMRGVDFEKTTSNFFFEFDVDVAKEKRRLIDVLRIKDLKKKLDALRETGSINKVAEMERQYALMIHAAVSKFPHRDTANNPAEMVVNRYLNCLGTSILAGGLLKELGISYLSAGVPEHAMIALITSDKKVYLESMNWDHVVMRQLTDENIVTGDNRPKITVKDIIAFSKSPKPEGLNFNIHQEAYRGTYPVVIGEESPSVVLFEPAAGEQLQVLSSTWIALADLGMHELAITALEHVTSTHPQYLYAYYGLGCELQEVKRYPEAVEALQKAIAIDPQYTDAYINLANTYHAMRRFDDALSTYREAMRRDPRNSDIYYNMAGTLRAMKRYPEAIEKYDIYLMLADWMEDYEWIGRARRAIREMKREK